MTSPCEFRGYFYGDDMVTKEEMLQICVLEASDRVEKKLPVYVWGTPQSGKSKTPCDFIKIQMEKLEIENLNIPLYKKSSLTFFNQIEIGSLFVSKLNNGNIEFSVIEDYDVYSVQISDLQRLELLEFLLKPYDERGLLVEEVDEE